jgi:hypothetical protein
MAVLGEKEIGVIKKLLHDALMAEWRAQGHYITGKVVEEIEYEINQTFEGVSITGLMPAYGGYINEGVSAANIPFSPGSGAGKSKYIEGLIGFVQKRMAVATLQEAKSVAFAIAHTQKRQGMPTIGSYKYTSTGKRTEWVNDALRKNLDKLGGYIREFYADYMRSQFQELIVTYSKTI